MAWRRHARGAVLVVTLLVGACLSQRGRAPVAREAGAAQEAFLATRLAAGRAAPPAERRAVDLARGGLRRASALARAATEQEKTEDWLENNQDKEAANDADWRIFAIAAAFICLLAVGIAG
mmetsp:Transcript_4035/g.9116  ORF Transcript_4035/g.9116 Transcript_4035/m.9116 type:complete len:121 (-) Transcript_4035:115-477(-)